MTRTRGRQIGLVNPGRRMFRRGDNVLAYWVDHAEGFEVHAGRRFRARVDAVVVDPRHGRAQALLVRSTRLHRKRLIPAQAVVAVDPFAKRLEVERGGPGSVRRASSAAIRLVLVGIVGITRIFGRSAERLGWLAVTTGRHARRLAARGSAIALRLVRAFEAAANSLVAWLRPRVVSLATGARRSTAAVGEKLRPRLRVAAQTALATAVTSVYLAAALALAAASWVAPRVRGLGEGAASATLVLGAATALGVQVMGAKVSRELRRISSARRHEHSTLL